MMTYEEMHQRLLSDKCAISTYISESGYYSITLERAGLKLTEQCDPSEDFFEAFRKLYGQYMRVTDAAPELVPHRLPSPKPVPESEYTEYTDVPAQKNEVPF